MLEAAAPCTHAAAPRTLTRSAHWAAFFSLGDAGNISRRSGWSQRSMTLLFSARRWPAYCLLLTAYHLLLTAYCLLLNTYYLLIKTTNYELLATKGPAQYAAYYLLLTTY